MEYNFHIYREAKPGVMWQDMHLTANRAMLEHLKKGNLLKGDVEDMIKVLCSLKLVFN